MYMHLIAIRKTDDQAFAYHFASDDFELVRKQRNRLKNALTDLPLESSLHILKTDAAGFASVQNLDPWFADTEPIESITVFRARLQRLVERDGPLWPGIVTKQN